MKKINLPTKITISRVIAATIMLIFIFVFYFLDQFNVLLISDANIYFNAEKTVYVNGYMLGIFALFLFACISDFFDGYLARKHNLVTNFGKFLDPVADKMLINSSMIFLAINFDSLNAHNHMKFPFFLVIIMVLRDLIVDTLRFIAAKNNIVISANIFGKVKTVFQMIAISLVLWNSFPFSFLDNSRLPYLHVSDLLCYIATFFSVLSGVIYVKQNIGVIRDKTDE